MENLGSILVSAILSGIFATIVTLWWQYKSRVKQEKTRIFTILMSKRYEITAEEGVEAMNMIDVVFYKSEKVRSVWKEFYELINSPENAMKAQAIKDKHLRLLEVMAEDIGYKGIKWENIKQYYYPVGLANRLTDEAVLRRVQIDAGLAQIKREKEHAEVTQIEPKEDLNNQMLLKVIENPEGFMKLIEAAEKAQKIGKTSKNKK